MEFCCRVLMVVNFMAIATVVAEPSSSCSISERKLLEHAFSSVSGFRLDGNCSEINLRSLNLSGSVSWGSLRNLSKLRKIDLSGNFLQGSIAGNFWSSPRLDDVNIAGNHLGGALRFDSAAPRTLRMLNLSSNRFTKVTGLRRLLGIKNLDLSRNNITANFPADLPALEGIDWLNISFNNFTGHVDSKLLKKFGRSAFIHAGSLTFASSHSNSSSSSPHTHKNGDVAQHKSNKARRVGFIAVGVSLLACFLSVIIYLVYSRRKKKSAKKEDDAEMVSAEVEAIWVSEARSSAPVVVFEKPLMELTFKDLVVATSGFGRESQLADGGRSSPLYRAVLPGDIHVVVRVLESARGLNEKEAAARFRDLARLRHPNLLPLFGYCIAGKENLLLYEYMERGDLHRWLHELPADEPDVEDFSVDAWENQQTKKCSTDWPTRHRIALGVARGLAFLHQGWVGSTRPVVHGHLVSSNILLGDDLEPRISDYTIAGDGSGTAEGDVYDFGVVVIELVTGQTGEAVEWVRGLVRDSKATAAVDSKLMAGASTEWEKEMVATLKISYLCTALSPEKRPTMQQIVGLLKDIRPTASASGSSSSSS